MPDTNKTRKNNPADPKRPRLSRRQSDALLQPYRDRLRRLAHDHEQLALTNANEIKFSALMKRDRDDAREALGRAERDGGSFRNANRGLLAERQDLLAKIAAHDKQVADLQARLNVAEQSARDLGVVQLKAENERLRDEIARMKGRAECERRSHADLVGELHGVIEYLAARLAIAVGTAAEVTS